MHQVFEMKSFGDAEEMLKLLLCSGAGKSTLIPPALAIETLRARNAQGGRIVRKSDADRQGAPPAAAHQHKHAIIVPLKAK